MSQATMKTSKGTITLDLFESDAPNTVKNFTDLAKKGYYDGLKFHRVIPNFMIQGGGYTPGLDLKEEKAFIPNESGNGLAHRRGTVALARLAEPHTANAQFFINLKDNEHLNPSSAPGRERWGYTVFGMVIDGMDVVDRIAAVETGPQGDFASDVPIVPVVIKSMKRYTFE